MKVVQILWRNVNKKYCLVVLNKIINCKDKQLTLDMKYFVVDQIQKRRVTKI